MRVTMLAALGLLVAATSGCSSDAEKICKKMKSIAIKAGKKAKDDGSQMDKCVASMKSRLENCGEKKAEFVQCFDAADSMKMAFGCFMMCKGGGSAAVPPSKPSSTSSKLADLKRIQTAYVTCKINCKGSASCISGCKATARAAMRAGGHMRRPSSSSSSSYSGSSRRPKLDRAAINCLRGCVRLPKGSSARMSCIRACARAAARRR